MSDSDIDKLVSLSWPLKMSGVVYLAELDLTFLRHVHLWCFFTVRVLNCPKISHPREYAYTTNEQETWLVSGSLQIALCHI